MSRPRMIDLRSVDDLVEYERQQQREDRDRLAGLRAGAFIVFSTICGVMLFGAACAWFFSVNG